MPSSLDGVEPMLSSEGADRESASFVSGPHCKDAGSGLLTSAGHVRRQCLHGWHEIVPTPPGGRHMGMMQRIRANARGPHASLRARGHQKLHLRPTTRNDHVHGQEHGRCGGHRLAAPRAAQTKQSRTSGTQCSRCAPTTMRAEMITDVNVN